MRNEALIMDNIRNISTEQLIKFESEIKDELLNRFVDQELEPKTKIVYSDDNNKLICKYCSGSNTIKAGTTKQSKQRYKCKDCNKYMIAERNTLLFSTKKTIPIWISFIESLLDGDSLIISSEKANISLRTAFRWRHKILYLMNNKMNNTPLTGVVTLDETLFPNIQKSKNVPLSTESAKRGMSSDKINVTCAVDELNNSILKVTDIGRVTADSLIQIYSGLIDEGASVVSDSLRSYHRLMNHLKVTWHKIPSKKKSIGEYTLEPINTFHALLKNFMRKYHGVSVKYLQGYLALFEFQRKNRNHHRNSVIRGLFLDLLSSEGHLKCEQIDSGSPIYY